MTDTRAYKGNGYWVTQIAASAVMAVLFAFLAVVIANSPGEDSGGQAFMVGLISILFFCTLIWLVKQFSRQTAEQRAIYAWVIMQQYGDRVQYDVAGDVQSMGMAKRASRGELTREEIDQLQEMRPDVPYPGKIGHS